MQEKSESEVAQSCPTPSDLMDCSLPGSSDHGIFQARVLEWDAIAFSGELVLDDLYYIEVYSLYILFTQMVKSACSAGDPGSISGSGRSLGERNGNPL